MTERRSGWLDREALHPSPSIVAGGLARCIHERADSGWWAVRSGTAGLAGNGLWATLPTVSPGRRRGRGGHGAVVAAAWSGDAGGGVLAGRDGRGDRRVQARGGRGPGAGIDAVDVSVAGRR